MASISSTLINFQGVDFWKADHPPVKHIDTREKIDWFELFLSRMRDYSDGEVWGNGDELMCKTEAIADAMCDLLFQLYAAQGEEVVFHTGYYDPAEDARSGEEDRCTGWWYVDCRLRGARRDGMKVPKYIREKMHRIALYAGMASNLDREVGLWLERNGIDVEKLSDGGGSGYEELSYGNDVTDELCAQIEQMEA